MINNSAGSEAAQLLGNMYREARERNNISLTTASEQLNIRSYLLNDMEKGRFGHLKLGDCLAYAKYLSVDIGVEEINKIRQIQGASGETYVIDRKVYVGGAVVLGVLAAAILALTSGSGKNDGVTPDNGVLQIPQNGGSGVIELPAANAPQTVEVPLVQQASAVQPAVSKVQTAGSLPAEQAKTAETSPAQQKAASGVVVGPDSGDVIVEEEIRFESLPDVEPSDAPVVAAPRTGTAVKTGTAGTAVAGTAPVADNAVQHQPARQTEKNAEVRKDVKPQNVSRREPARTAANTSVTKVQNTAATAERKAQTRTQTATAGKSTGLKSGQVVSLADELGYQKPARASQTSASKQSAKPAQKSAQSQTAAAPKNVSSGAKSGGLKSGQVVSLADEMGYQKKTSAPKNTGAAVSSGNSVKSGVVGPKITDQAEIKRRASQVVITEAVQ